jgi:hypothetical protein
MTISRARTTGAVYLLYFVLVIGAEASIGRTPAALSDAANLIANAAYIVVTLLLYQLFNRVNRNLAVLAVTTSVVGCVIQSLSLFHLVPALSALPIFGLFNLTIGILILKSTFLPRGLGVLMVLSGLGWLTVLSPELLKHISTYVEILGIAAEGSLILWLLVKGVNVERWDAQARG